MDARRHAAEQASRGQQLAFQAQSAAQQAIQSAQLSAQLAAQAAQCCQTVLSAATDGQVPTYGTYTPQSGFVPQTGTISQSVPNGSWS